LFSNIDISESIFSSIFLEANLYIIGSIFFILISLTSQIKRERASKIKQLFSFNFQSFISYFFRDIIYYISIALFYGAFFLIFQEVFWNIIFPQIFLFFNIIVILLFLWEKKVSIFWDFLRVNTSIISLYYIVYHLIFIFWWNVNFSWYDILNIFCIFILMYLFLYNSPKENYKNIFYIYIYSFLFLELCVLFKIVFIHNIFSFSILAFMFGLILSSFSWVFKKRFNIPLFITRFFWVVFLSLHIFLSSFLVFQENTYSIIGLLFLPGSIYLLIIFHKYFQNYIALFFACTGVVAFLSSIFLLLLEEKNQKTYMYALYFIISIGFLFVHQCIKSRSEYDKYFFHIFSFIVNLFCVFLFFFFTEFSILTIGFFLLAESVYFSVSYYSLKKESHETISNQILWN
jgi:hypothetical protein